MAATVNHTIVAARDAGVMFQFAALPEDASPTIQPQHYAFLVDGSSFDRALDRIRADGLEHWADPQRTRPGETNTQHGGRGVCTCSTRSATTWS